MNKENKKQITEKIEELLRLTRRFSDLEGLEYVQTPAFEEYVVAYFESGAQKQIYVTADSGIAMIQDVVARLY